MEQFAATHQFCTIRFCFSSCYLVHCALYLFNYYLVVDLDHFHANFTGQLYKPPQFSNRMQHQDLRQTQDWEEMTILAFAEERAKIAERHNFLKRSGFSSL